MIIKFFQFSKFSNNLGIRSESSHWSNDVPLVTTAAPTTPEANPTTVASTESPITDVPITNAPIEDLPDFNNLS